MILKKQVCLVLLAFFIAILESFSLHSSIPPISAKSKGTISGTIEIPDSKGTVTLSLSALTGEKLQEKKVNLPKESDFVFSGCKPSFVYIVEAEGELELASENGTELKHYSRAAKVTTDEKGSASVSFGN